MHCCSHEIIDEVSVDCIWAKKWMIADMKRLADLGKKSFKIHLFIGNEKYTHMGLVNKSFEWEQIHRFRLLNIVKIAIVTMDSE